MPVNVITVRTCGGALLLAAALIGGCASDGTPRAARTKPPARTLVVATGHDPLAAAKLNEEGLQHLDHGELDQAQDAFTRALAADGDLGAAHNNLGKVLYQRRDWYQSAWEFDAAAKLLPRAPEPQNNLGLVYEKAGQLDQAVDHYRQAVALDPASAEFAGNLARALLQRGERSAEVRRLLEQVVAHDTRPAWLIWARQQLAGMGNGLPPAGN